MGPISAYLYLEPTWSQESRLNVLLNQLSLFSHRLIYYLFFFFHNIMDPVELKRVFEMFDRNGDGRITRKELNDSLENLGIFIPDLHLRQMINNMDANGDGCLDIHEFGELYHTIMAQRNDHDEDDMREAFDVFDRNGDGFITVDELRSVLSSLGLKQGKAMEECRKMIMKVDVDGDGRVDFSEFKLMMKAGGFGDLE